MTFDAISSEQSTTGSVGIVAQEDSDSSEVRIARLQEEVKQIQANELNRKDHEKWVIATAVAIITLLFGGAAFIWGIFDRSFDMQDRYYNQLLDVNERLSSCGER